MIISGKVQDLEQDTKAVIDRFSLLIKKVIQGHLHRSDDIDLEDIEQEVRLKIWTFLKKGNNVRNLPSYIKKVAYSTTIDELRKMMKQRPSGDAEKLIRFFAGAALPSGQARDHSPEAGIEDSEAREKILALVDSLSENRKKVLRLYLTGLSIDEICASLNWERPKVRHLFYRGIDDLKEKARFLRGSMGGSVPGAWPPGGNHGA